MRISVQQLLAWKPCGDWNFDTVYKVFNNKLDISIEEFIELNSITSAEKLWLLLRPEIIPINILEDLTNTFLNRMETYTKSFQDPLEKRRAEKIYKYAKSFFIEVDIHQKVFGPCWFGGKLIPGEFDQQLEIVKQILKDLP